MNEQRGHTSPEREGHMGETGERGEDFLVGTSAQLQSLGGTKPDKARTLQVEEITCRKKNSLTNVGFLVG